MKNLQNGFPRKKVECSPSEDFGQFAAVVVVVVVVLVVIVVFFCVVVIVVVVFLDVFVVKHPRAFPRNSFGLIGKFS